MAKKNEPATPTTAAADPLANQIPDPPFQDHVVVTHGLDTKTYRLANRARTPEQIRELAERVLKLEAAPAELKAQAQQVLAR